MSAGDSVPRSSSIPKSVSSRGPRSRSAARSNRPEAAYVIERLVDLAAHQLGLNPAALRRLNFIGSDQFPYQTPVALAYDSGNYAPALDLALRKADYPSLLEEQAQSRREGRYIG